MERYLREPVQRDLTEKMVLIGGPRQSGKTTLAEALLERYAYFNYDSEQDRRVMRHKQWPRDVPLVIFDEHPHRALAHYAPIVRPERCAARPQRQATHPSRGNSHRASGSLACARIVSCSCSKRTKWTLGSQNVIA